MGARKRARTPSSPIPRSTRNGDGYTAGGERKLPVTGSQPPLFQGLEPTAGLPLAATMGRLADHSLCPVGACSEHDGGHFPAPKGLHRTPRRQSHGNPETRAWTPFPYRFDGTYLLSVAQAVKLVNFQRPALPTINSVSRNVRGPGSRPPQPPSIPE